MVLAALCRCELRGQHPIHRWATECVSRSTRYPRPWLRHQGGIRYRREVYRRGRFCCSRNSSGSSVLRWYVLDAAVFQQVLRINGLFWNRLECSGAKCALSGSYIFSKCVIEDNVKISNSLLCDGARVGRGATIGPECVIAAGVSLDQSKTWSIDIDWADRASVAFFK